MVTSWGAPPKPCPRLENGQEAPRPTTLLATTVLSPKQGKSTSKAASTKAVFGDSSGSSGSGDNSSGSISSLSNGNGSNTSINISSSTSSTEKGKKIVAIGTGGKNPLPGFDKFIYETLLRTLFEIPLKDGFDAADGQTQVVFAEMAALHKTILIVQGLEYVDYLKSYLHSIQCPANVSEMFADALVQLPTKQFLAVLKVTKRRFFPYICFFSLWCIFYCRKRLWYDATDKIFGRTIYILNLLKQ